MKEILYNYDYLTLEEIEETVIRTKMLIINSKKEILLGYCHKTYQFPGGHLEEGETLVECLKREILEETGMEVSISEDAKPFFVIRHYSKNYRGTGKTRCNEIYYYVILTDDTYNLEKIRHDEWEKDGNYQLRYVHLDNVEQVLIDSIPDNPQNKVIVQEMIEVLNEYRIKIG